LPRDNATEERDYMPGWIIRQASYRPPPPEAVAGAPRWLVVRPVDVVGSAALGRALESGTARVSEVAELIGKSRQRVAGWCLEAKEARARWLDAQWRSALTVAKEAEAARIKGFERSPDWLAWRLEELEQRCAKRLGKQLIAADDRRLIELWNAATSPAFHKELPLTPKAPPLSPGGPTPLARQRAC
jgi:hypothetical protein